MKSNLKWVLSVYIRRDTGKSERLFHILIRLLCSILYERKKIFGKSGGTNNNQRFVTKRAKSHVIHARKRWVQCIFFFFFGSFSDFHSVDRCINYLRIYIACAQLQPQSPADFSRGDAHSDLFGVAFYISHFFKYAYAFIEWIY